MSELVATVHAAEIITHVNTGPGEANNTRLVTLRLSLEPHDSRQLPRYGWAFYFFVILDQHIRSAFPF